MTDDVGAVHRLELKKPRLGGYVRFRLTVKLKTEILEPTLMGPVEIVGPDTGFSSSLTRLAVSSISVAAVTTQHPQNPEG